MPRFEPVKFEFTEHELRERRKADYFCELAPQAGLYAQWEMNRPLSRAARYCGLVIPQVVYQRLTSQENAVFRVEHDKDEHPDKEPYEPWTELSLGLLKAQPSFVSEEASPYEA